MKLSDVMTRGVEVVSPQSPLAEAARLMRQGDVGSLPVCDQDRLVGMVTDRDIAVRGVANGCSPEDPVRDVMSSNLQWCTEDTGLDEALRQMRTHQIRRLPVLDAQKRLVGIVALADVALELNEQTSGHVLEGISEAASPAQ